jgi:outer membrane protein
LREDGRVHRHERAAQRPIKGTPDQGHEEKISMIKFERIAWAGLTVAAIGITSAFTITTAQSKTPRVCFVTAQQILDVHPKGAEIKGLRDSANKELQPLQTQGQTIQQKIAAGTATAAERQQLDTLSKTVQATTKKWQDKINKALDPVTKEIDDLIKVTARAQGCSVVMDRGVAQQSALVVYADDDTNITDEVIKGLKK